MTEAPAFFSESVLLLLLQNLTFKEFVDLSEAKTILGFEKRGGELKSKLFEPKT